ncbi:F0F1 ATP synthase subunit B [Aestuariimicrobium ganziense]|uniref:F0F1 ATP synthase subunit B n=1 Tax=Aestuariimicrobium ganziense TaxID=2773677 RepID=UPI00194061B2|nr:F0F1 ATP synthase subunit B [Aestuariimicrobium ganziense]
MVAFEINLGPLAPHYLSEIIMGIVLMVLIIVVLAKAVVPAFEKMYAERADAIQGGMERAEKAQAEAEQALQEYRSQLAEAREEAAKIREDAKNQGAQILAEMRERAAKESERMVESARAQIEAERAQASSQLRAEVGGLATTLAGKIVGESLTDDQRARGTVERFLAELESTPIGAGER